jgi:hypothetical protein
MTAALTCYDNDDEWKPVPGLCGISASIQGPIRAGERVLTARLIPDEGLFVPVEGILLPAHILIAVTHLPQRPNYSWFEITGYLSQLVEHINEDRLDNRVGNLRWVPDPGDWDYEILMQAPRYGAPSRCRMLA